MSADRSGYVYLMYSESTDWCKIGHSKDPEKRLAQVNTEVPGLSWKLGCQMYCEDRYAVEKAWHEALSGHRITRGKEWFTLTTAQVKLFKTLCEQVRRAPDSCSGVEFADDVIKEAEEVVEMARARSQPDYETTNLPWNNVLQQLKKNRQALTAGVFAEAHVSNFDGATLTLGFPENLSFYAAMAYERHHHEQLCKALEQQTGERLNVEVKVMEAA